MRSSAAITKINGDIAARMEIAVRHAGMAPPKRDTDGGIPRYRRGPTFTTITTTIVGRHARPG
jgi:hypothetical protein